MIKKLLSFFLSVLCLAYVALLAGYLLLSWTWPGTTWWLNLLDTFALYVFLPVVPLLLLGLLLRSRPTLLLCTFPVLVFALLYGEVFLPNQQATAQTGTAFTVMTYNVLAAPRDLQSMVQMIVEEDPDVIALQELTPDIADFLTARLSADYRYQALAPVDGVSGAGVLSRFEIKEEETFNTMANGHLAQHLVLDVNGEDLHLFNLHPHPPSVQATRRRGIPPVIVRGFDTEWQAAQIEEMIAKVESVEGPVVVAGDFNLTDQTRSYRRVTKNLVDTHREAGKGLGHTFPAGGLTMGIPLRYPMIRIDYVFHSRELVGLDAHAGENAGSDHRPVVARLAFQDGS